MVWAGSRSKELIKSLTDFFKEKKMWHSENENAGKQHPFFSVFHDFFPNKACLVKSFCL